MGLDQKPLVSLLVYCYNQQQTIAQAVRSALEQTYSPLEVVIQDDHSSDGTVEVVRKIVDEYRGNGGRHTIVVRVNSQNLGIVRNFEDAARASHGQLIVTAAGDDISLPSRVERIVKAWIEDGRRAALITHSGVTIDMKGRVRGKIGPHSAFNPLGACMAYRRDVFDGFRKVDESLRVYEDNVFPIRALMVGSELYLPESLIQYRLGAGASNSARKEIDFTIRVTQNGIASTQQLLNDLEDCRGSLPEDKYNEWKGRLQARKEFWEAWWTLITAKKFLQRWKGFIVMCRWSHRIAPLHVLFLLPQRFYRPLYEVYARRKNKDRYDK